MIFSLHAADNACGLTMETFLPLTECPFIYALPNLMEETPNIIGKYFDGKELSQNECEQLMKVMEQLREFHPFFLQWWDSLGEAVVPHANNS